MIEKHYGKYIRNDADEQLSRLKTVTLTVTPQNTAVFPKPKRLESQERRWWAHLDSNQGPTGYEPVALTN